MNPIIAKINNVSPEEDFNTEAMTEDIVNAIDDGYVSDNYAESEWTRDQALKAYGLALEQQKLDALCTLVKLVQSIDDTLIRM